MMEKERVQHEGTIKGIQDRSIEVLIYSRSACSACHAKNACGLADTKEKIISIPRTDEKFDIGDKVYIYASLNQAYQSVLLAYVVPSLLVIISIFLFQSLGSNELHAAIGSLILLAAYFYSLYLFRHRMNRKIKFTIEKTGN